MGNGFFVHVLRQPFHVTTQFIGLTAYADALQLMETALSSLRPGEGRIWGLEHPLVYTSGLKTEAQHILNSALQVIPARRGGSVTLHNAGQLVVYFALPLSAIQGGLERFVRVLEAVMAETLMSFGVPVNLMPGTSGVFAAGTRDAGGGKIAFVGLGLKKNFIYHGISINVANDLNDFRSIMSCGLTLPMTNIAAFVANAPEPAAVFAVFAELLAERFGETEPAAFRERIAARYDLNDWPRGFRLGWLAFHERRYWEAHEIWEMFWHEMPPGELRIFFHALIQMAMAFYKMHTVPNLVGAQSLLAKALEKFSVTREIRLLQNQEILMDFLQQCEAELIRAASAVPGESKKIPEATSTKLVPPVLGWHD